MFIWSKMIGSWFMPQALIPECNFTHHIQTKVRLSGVITEWRGNYRTFTSWRMLIDGSSVSSVRVRCSHKTQRHHRNLTPWKGKVVVWTNIYGPPSSSYFVSIAPTNPSCKIIWDVDQWFSIWGGFTPGGEWKRLRVKEMGIIIQFQPLSQLNQFWE